MSPRAFGLQGTVEERFLAKCAPPDENGCIRWLGAKNNRGYGQIRIGGRKGKAVLAHRYAWERKNGPIPRGREIDHVRARGCRAIDCVNEKHLEPVTHRENCLRGDSPAARHALVTHCPHGHEYTAENTGIAKKGSRFCKTCGQIRGRAYRARKAAAQ